MRRQLKTVGLFLLGVAVGIGLMCVVISKTYLKQFQDQYVLGVMDQANVALQVRDGRQEELAQSIEARLPSYVTAVHDSFPQDAYATEALWMIKAYYQKNHVPIPPNIQSILAALPPQPPTSCQLRLQALAKKTPKKP